MLLTTLSRNLIPLVSSLNLLGVFIHRAKSSFTTLNHTAVLILGGGMTGVIAARTLHEQDINDSIILDAQAGLGGRMIPKPFDIQDRQVVVRMGSRNAARHALGSGFLQGERQDAGYAIAACIQGEGGCGSPSRRMLSHIRAF